MQRSNTFALKVLEVYNFELVNNILRVVKAASC